MSPRTKRCRKLDGPPSVKGFKPIGVPFRHTMEIVIHLEEYEAIRLALKENLPQEEAALRMGVSRPTFTRIYNKALQKVAQAFVEGRSIVFNGGDVEFDQEWYRCLQCHTVFTNPNSKEVACPNCKATEIENINQSLQEWRQGGRGKGCRNREKRCVCPQCGQEKQGKPGVPCRETQCPQCHQPMHKLRSDT